MTNVIYNTNLAMSDCRNIRGNFDDGIEMQMRVGRKQVRFSLANVHGYKVAVVVPREHAEYVDKIMAYVGKRIRKDANVTGDLTPRGH